MTPALCGAALLFAAALAASAPPPALRGFNSIGEKPFGTLLLGEGGDRDWKATVEALRKQLGDKAPFEFAPGLADRRAMQRGLDRLQAQRVKLIVIVPLFISSFGPVMDQNRYLLGIREKPSDEFARRGAPPARLKSKVPIVLAKALDDHPLFVDVLASRASSLSRKPAEEAVALVGEAPASAEDRKEWAAAMGALAEKVRQKGGFGAAKAFGLRTGRQKEREQSESELRTLVKDLRRERKVIVVPLTMSSSGPRLARALDGLFAKHDGRAILPDARVAQWAEESAIAASKLPDMRLYKDIAARGAPSPAPPPLPQPGETK